MGFGIKQYIVQYRDYVKFFTCEEDAIHDCYKLVLALNETEHDKVFLYVANGVSAKQITESLQKV
jgi:hypothetical protein